MQLESRRKCDLTARSESRAFKCPQNDIWSELLLSPGSLAIATPARPPTACPLLLTAAKDSPELLVPTLQQRQGPMHRKQECFWSADKETTTSMHCFKQTASATANPEHDNTNHSADFPPLTSAMSFAFYILLRQPLLLLRQLSQTPFNALVYNHPRQPL